MTTIQIFIDDKNPNGLKSIEMLLNWKGKVISFPRTQISKYKENYSKDDIGIYILEGDAPKEYNKQQIYVGQGKILDRISSHDANQDMGWWSSAVVIIPLDESIKIDYLLYIEQEIIDYFHNAETKYTLWNSNRKSNRTNLRQQEKDDIDIYIDNIKIILKLLELSPERNIIRTNEELMEYHFCRESIVDARLIIDNENGKYIVKKGSECLKLNQDSLPAGYRRLKETLIQDEILKNKDDNKYYFAQDTSFNSLSAAACIINGTSYSGTEAWKDKNGKTIKQIENEVVDKNE